MSIFKSKQFWIPFASILVSGSIVIGSSVAIVDKINEKSINKQNDSGFNNLTYLERFLRSFSVDSFELDESISRLNTYAFDVTTNKIHLKKDITIPQGIEFSYEVANKNQYANDFNNGRVRLILKASNETEQKSSWIELSGFKHPDESLKKLFTKDSNGIIDLEVVADRKTGTSLLSSLQDFNTTKKYKKENQSYKLDASNGEVELNNLSLILKQHSTFKDSKDKQVKETIANSEIVGKVKLDKISLNKRKNKTYFHLSALDENQLLKVIKKDGQNNVISQALISEIITTNLLATDITANVISKNQEKTQELRNKLVNKGFKQDHKDLSLNRDLSFDLSSNNTNEVFIKPAWINSNELEEETLGFSFVITFGKDDYIKTYNTLNEEELKELKEAGFSFGVYTKSIDKSIDEITPDYLKINEAELAKSYLSPDKYNNATMRLTLNANPFSFKGGFILTEARNSVLANAVSVREMPKPDTNKNWIAFADYTYQSFRRMHRSIFSPSLSLIHFEHISEEMNK